MNVATLNTSGTVSVTGGSNTNSGACTNYPAGGTNTTIGAQGATGAELGQQRSVHDRHSGTS